MSNLSAATNDKEEAMKMHEKWKGKIEVISRVSVKSSKDLSLAYTPGVAEPCKAINKNIDLSHTLTRRGNLVAVITDGTAVLGLGDIGPEAAMPVMEGKCVLFKEFADVDALPLCIRSKDPDVIVETIKLLAGSFGAINLEDISAPRCFEIEKRLKAECDIPVFHDDQHGTAVVVLAGLINALRIVKKDLNSIRIVINGAGSAGTSICKLLLLAGAENIIMCDRKGILVDGAEWMNPAQQEISVITNKAKLEGTLEDALLNADVFVGTSAPGALTPEMVRTMSKDPIVFALANPVPEIMPDLAREAGAIVVGTGRSDFPNQINNVLAFPGIFRATLDVRAKDINEHMKIAAAKAIASVISDEELTQDYIIPEPFDPRVTHAVVGAVSEAARKSGVARL
ncbi:NAD(P)-dependent malic enzyme [Alkalibacter mobilis]|uniref:NAD(P)-dependent malic enzyme n=1 Tax=Alkalibacter mobilis TaxID=2787712 RepID=UPI00189FED41|nr:NADP-dependent malic enzyme [Alkalibacter mobilis]MBF7096740.1 NADP-dependent malic enzyme [Alkalibacter mobilis]